MDPLNINSLQPIVQASLKDLSDRVCNEIIPAIGQELKAEITLAVTGLNQDSQAAIAALSTKIDTLVPSLKSAAEEIIDKFFADLKSTLGGVRIKWE